MRNLILALFIVTLISSGLYFTPKTSAAVSTTLANPGTPLSSTNNYTWQYPKKLDCSTVSSFVPYAAYTFDITASGNYTFTMNTNGFNGVIHVYRIQFNPNDPCSQMYNPGSDNGGVITGSTLTVPLTTSIGLNRWVAVFSAANAGEGGTFSAEVSGPAAVTLVPGSNFGISSQTASKSVTSGCTQTMAVYANGTLPHTFQWYEGVDGDLTNSILIPGATSHIYTTPPLTSDKSYWLRITQGSEHKDSQTIKFKVYATNSTYFSGSLDTNQTWNLTTSLCHPSGTFVHYRSTQIRIPVGGQYKIHINRGNNFTGGYAINIYSGTFDATQPCSGFADASVNSDLTLFLQPGSYSVVVSTTSASEGPGDFDGSISTASTCALPETIEEALIVSGHPLDKAISPGSTASLTFAYTGGTGGAKTLQWYKGFSGDTSQPINGATTTNYTTPALNQTPINEPTYYYYWARVSDPAQGTYADTRTAVINVLNPPITYSDVLSQCDETYTQVGGPTTFYKIFPFTVSTDGTYTFSVSASGFTPAVRLYQGFFSPQFPNINYYGPGGTQNILASPNTYYLVITSTLPNRTGSFTLNINGPSLVVPTPRPIINTQPVDKIIGRGQTATFTATSNTPDVSYQWYTGTCGAKTAVNGANANSYTTPAMTDYANYWVKVSYGVMYVNSNIAQVKIRPQAITDGYIIDEDTPLNVAAPGVLANDKKADSMSLTAFKVTDPTLGTRTLGSDGALSYTPNPNVAGPDVFMYKVSDGILESDPENIAILIREVNDAPFITNGSLNNHTFNEDSVGGVLHLGGVNYNPGGGTDEASQQLAYKVTAVPPATVGNVLLADNTTVVTANTTYTLAQIRLMQFKPATNGYGGPYPFTFTVTDNGTTRGAADPQSITQSLDITVKAIADTPSATGATTNEDTQTTSGLVLERNAADGAEVGYFKIGAIRGGTLYKNDGITQINHDQFITYAEGHAGLKFSPNANQCNPNNNFSFDVQASLTNLLDGLGGSLITVPITVNPVADTPSITNATTNVNRQTTSGLVITRNPLDGSEVKNYKISSIANGTIYQADGVTQIGEGQFITAAEGAAGLKFTPAPNSTSNGSFNVQASVNNTNAGLGGAIVAATITVLNVTLSINDVAIAEGANGVRQVVFRVSLSSPSSVPVTVQYQIEDNTASAPDDFTALALTSLTIPANTSSATITVQVNGDIIREGNETFFVNLSNPIGATILDGQGMGTIKDDEPQVADLSGDGLTDAASWDSSNGNWWVRDSQSGTLTLIAEDWGRAALGDISVPGDYDGDNLIDIAIWRPSEGNWYILKSGSGNAPSVQGWGQSGDVPVPGDYNRDGKTDYAVFRISDGNWYILLNGGGNSVRGWGTAGDKPVPDDYDGDGQTDIAVFRPSEGNWYIINSSTGTITQTNWGLSTDQPVPGDYDGDGKTDVAVYRSGVWYIRNSTGGSTVKGWGDATDMPVPGDYDGDGKFDIAIWRGSEGNWYVIRSSDNTVSLQNTPASGIPVPSAYLPQ